MCLIFDFGKGSTLNNIHTLTHHQSHKSWIVLSFANIRCCVVWMGNNYIIAWFVSNTTTLSNILLFWNSWYVMGKKDSIIQCLWFLINEGQDHNFVDAIRCGPAKGSSWIFFFFLRRRVGSQKLSTIRKTARTKEKWNELGIKR